MRRAFAIDVFEQVLDKGNEVDLGAMIGHLRPSVVRPWVPPPRTDCRCRRGRIRSRASPGAPGCTGKGARVSREQLLALLVQADDRFLGSERASIQIEQVVHPLPVFLGQHANAPHQLAPRLEAVFFSSRRIVSRLIGPIPACACAACSSKPSVQRLAPAGGAEQAKAVICASTSVSYWRGLPGRATSCRAYSTPAFQIRRPRAPDGRSSHAQHLHDLGFRDPRSSAAKICARLTSRAWCKPFARY